MGEFEQQKAVSTAEGGDQAPDYKPEGGLQPDYAVEEEGEEIQTCEEGGAQEDILVQQRQDPFYDPRSPNNPNKKNPNNPNQPNNKGNGSKESLPKQPACPTVIPKSPLPPLENYPEESDRSKMLSDGWYQGFYNPSTGQLRIEFKAAQPSDPDILRDQVNGWKDLWVQEHLVKQVPECDLKCSDAESVYSDVQPDGSVKGVAIFQCEGRNP